MASFLINRFGHTRRAFESDWDALRAVRIALVDAARRGHLDAIAALRVWILYAGVFAILNVQNSVTSAETTFLAWLRGEPIAGLKIHVRAAESVGAWLTAHWDIETMADLSGREFIVAADGIHGLGPAKASFMAALLGFDFAPCIDRHMARMFNLPESYGSQKAYWEAVARTPFAHTLDQWYAFLSVPRFETLGHAVYFDAVRALGLGNVECAMVDAVRVPRGIVI